MEKTIKWEKPALRDLNKQITIGGTCTPYGSGYTPTGYDDCPNTGNSATYCAPNGGSPTGT